MRHPNNSPKQKAAKVAWEANKHLGSRFLKVFASTGCKSPWQKGRSKRVKIKKGTFAIRVLRSLAGRDLRQVIPRSDLSTSKRIRYAA